MSDQSTGSAGREDNTSDERPSYDDEHFGPDATVPTIDLSPVSVPPLPEPPVVGLPDVVPAIRDDEVPGSSARSTADDDAPVEEEEPSASTAEPTAGEGADTPSSGDTTSTSGDTAADERGEEPPASSTGQDSTEMPLQPTSTPPWSGQSAAGPAVSQAAPPPPPPPPPPAAQPPSVPPPPPPAAQPPGAAQPSSVPPAAPVPPSQPVPPRPPAAAYSPSPPGGTPAPPQPPQQAPGYPPQAPPGYGQASYQPVPQVPDAHGVGIGFSRISPGSQPAARPGATVLAAVLEDGDVVDLLIQGNVRGRPGVAALVGAKLLLVNAREWEPEVVTLPVTSTLQVQGMQQGPFATLVLTDGETQEMVDRIGDAQLAIAMAERIRARVATAAAEA